MQLPAIAGQDEFISVGEDLFYQRSIGELLSPELEAAAVLVRARA